MPPETTLTTLFRHNRWANLRLLEQCAVLSDAQLDATIVGGFGSIRDTLQHIAYAERSYTSRITTGQPYRRPADAPPLSLDELRDFLARSGEQLIEWAPRVGPEERVQVDWDGVPQSVPTSVILTQVINHATEHRAQVMAILTQLGIEPDELSGWAYYGDTESL